MLRRSRAYTGISSPERVYNCCFSLSRNKLGCGALICRPLSASHVEIRPGPCLPWSRRVLVACVNLTQTCKYALYICTYANKKEQLCSCKDRSCSAHSISIVSLTFTKNWHIQSNFILSASLFMVFREKREHATSHEHTGNRVGRQNRVIGALSRIRGLWSLWEWLAYVCVTSSCPDWEQTNYIMSVSC